MILNPRFNFGPHYTPPLDYSLFKDRVVLRLSSMFLLFNHVIYYVDFQPSTLGRDPLLRTLSTLKLKFPIRKTFKTFVDAVGVQFTSEPLNFLDNLPVTTTIDRPDHKA